MKHGFMLIELIISTLIASMISGILLTALSQGGRIQLFVDNIVDRSLRIGVVANQLEKDLMGAFIPVQADLAENKEGSPDENSFGADDKKSDNKKTDDKKVSEKEGKGKEKQKPLEKIFYGTNKEGNIDQLTFITNNPLVVFVGKDIGEIKPKIARVIYSLKPEADKVNSYILYRQESLELDLAQSGTGRQYEIINGVKSLSVTYTARTEKKQESKAAQDQSAKKETPKVSYEYKTSKDWVSERKKEGDKEQELPRIPYSLEIKIVLWDKQDKNEKEFTLVVEIPTDFAPAKTADTPQKKTDQPKTPEAASQEDKSEKGIAVTHNSRGNKTENVTIRVIESAADVLKNAMRVFG